MNRISNKLRSNKILVSDAAWGTFLHAKGLKGGECAPNCGILNVRMMF